MNACFLNPSINTCDPLAYTDTVWLSVRLPMSYWHTWSLPVVSHSIDLRINKSMAFNVHLIWAPWFSWFTYTYFCSCMLSMWCLDVLLLSINSHDSLSDKLFPYALVIMPWWAVYAYMSSVSICFCAYCPYALSSCLDAPMLICMNGRAFISCPCLHVHCLSAQKGLPYSSRGKNMYFYFEIPFLVVFPFCISRYISSRKG